MTDLLRFARVEGVIRLGSLHSKLERRLALLFETRNPKLSYLFDLAASSGPRSFSETFKLPRPTPISTPGFANP